MSRLPVSIAGALIRDAARSDLRDTLLFIATNNPVRASKFAQSFARTVENLVTMPGMGSPREVDDARLRGLRVWPVADFKTYLIFYKPLIAGSGTSLPGSGGASNNGIEIVRVLHHSRDFEALLDDEETFANA